MAMWIGYARTRKEFDVEAAILDLGISAEVPRQVEAKRQGKRRFPDPVITPGLPNYVFVTCADGDWHRLQRVKHLSPAMIAVPAHHQPQILRYLANMRQLMQERLDAIEAGQRLEEYSPGELFTIAAGQFAGHVARFRRIVETAHSLFPEIEAEIEAFGRVARIRVDPLAARKAG